MVNDADRSKVMAYVHGELGDAEAMAFAKRIEADPELRSEIDIVGRASRQVAEHFATVHEIEPDVGLSAEQILKIRSISDVREPKRSRLWIAGAIVAVAAALVIYRTLEKTPDSPDSPVVAPPPVQVAPPTEAEPDLQPSPSIPAPTESAAAQAVEAAPAQNALEEKEEEAPPRFLHFTSARMIVPKALNRAKIVRYLAKRMEHNENCITPAADAGRDSQVRVRLSTAPDGKILGVETIPKYPTLASCLKKRLAGKPDVFRSTGAGRSQVTFYLKIQGG